MGTRKDVGHPIFPGKFVVQDFSWRQMKNRTDRKLESKVSGQGERFEEEEAMVHVNSLQLEAGEDSACSPRRFLFFICGTSFGSVQL